MKKAFVLSICLFVFAGLAFSQRVKENGVVIDKTAQRIVEKIIAEIKADSPFKVSFSMTTKNQGKETASLSGTLVSNGNKFALISSEYEDYSDGKNVWHFVKSNNEVELTGVNDENNALNITGLIERYAKDYRPKLIREENRGNSIVNIIDLVPKGKSGIAKIRIVSDKKTNRLKEMTISIREGNTYTYKFNKYETKVKVRDNDFVFPKSKYPKAEIIDLR